MTIDRRMFLRIGACGAAGLGLAGLGLADAPSEASAITPLLLRGGADGLSLVAPIDDSAYVLARPTLALRGGFFVGNALTMNRRMPALAERLKARTAVVFIGVGQAGDVREHDPACMRLHHEFPGSLTMTGWDTHAHDGPADQGLLGELASELDQRFADLTRTDPDRTVLAISEFGRGIRSGGLGGTEHGWGSVAIAVGPLAHRLHLKRGAVLGSYGDLGACEVLTPTLTPRMVGDLLLAHRA